MAARLRPQPAGAAGGESLLVEDEVEPGMDLKAMADMALGDRQGPGIAFFTSGERFVLKVSRELAERFNALELKRHIGQGGGRPDFVQGKLDRPREEAVKYLQEISK